MSFLINPVRARNGALFLKFFPVLCGGAAAVYIWTVEPLPHLALGISEPLVRQLIDDRTWINSRMINAQVVEQQSLVSLNESWLRSSCKHYVLLIDAFYDTSNLIYAFYFIKRSMMDGILHEGTTTSFFSETWVLTTNMLLQHPSVQIIEKLLSKILSIPEYKKIEIAMVDSKQSIMLLSQS